MLMRSDYRNRGFTIVELLIVIVVIGILAAIVIVAFNGVQNRANDTALQTDVRNYTNKVMQFNALNGRYPYPNTGNELPTLGVKFSPSTLSALNPTSNNMLYCGNNSTGAGFAIIGSAKSGTKYITTSDNTSPQIFTGTLGGGSATCTAISTNYTTWQWGIDAAGVPQI